MYGGMSNMYISMKVVTKQMYKMCVTKKYILYIKDHTLFRLSIILVTKISYM